MKFFLLLHFAEFKQNGQSCIIFLENEIKSGGLWCKFLDITKKCMKCKLNLELFFSKHSQ